MPPSTFSKDPLVGRISAAPYLKVSELRGLTPAVASTSHSVIGVLVVTTSAGFVGGAYV